MKLSILERSALRRLEAGGRILKTAWNASTLEKWVRAGLAKYDGHAVVA